MPGVLDENVVVLKFDNSDFEKNTKKSMETLEQMKQSFKSSGSGEEFEKIGKAAKNVDLSGLEKGVERLNQRFSVFGQIGTAAIQNLTNYAINSTRRIVTAVPRQIIEGGWKRALNIEQAKFQIEGLKQIWDETSEGFKEGAKTVKASVLDAVNGTAYGLDEAAKVAAQFSASGMKAGDEMTKSLRAISGVAAMTSSSYEDIGRIFTTVSGNGRLMGDQLLQLSSRGINAAATLADAMHTTEESVREMVSKGEIDFKTFYTAMDNAFGEHAKKANDTYTGSLANMKAALSRIGADVEAKKLENLRHIFNALTPVIDQIHTLLGGVIERINSMSTAVSDFAVRGLRSIEFALNPFVSAIKGETQELSFIPSLMEDAYIKLTKNQRKLTDNMTATAKEAKVAWDIINNPSKYSKDRYERKKQINEMGLSFKKVQRYTNALIKNNLDAETCHIKVEGAAKKASKATTEYGKSTEKAAENAMKLSPMVQVVGGLVNMTKAAKSAFTGFKGVMVTFGKAAKEALGPLASAASSKFLSFTKKLADSAKDFEVFGIALTKSKAKEYLSGRGFGDGNKFKQRILEFKGNLASFTKDAKNHVQTIVTFFGQLRSKLSESGKIDSMIASFKKLRSAIAELANNKLGVVRKELDKLFGMFKQKATLDNAVAGIENLANKITGFVKGLVDGEGHLKRFVSMFSSLEGKITGMGALKFNFGKESAAFKNIKNTAMGAVLTVAEQMEKHDVSGKLSKAANGVQTLTNAAVASSKKFDGKAAAKGIFGFFKSLDYNKIADFGLKITGIVAIFKTVKQLGDLTNATVGMMGSVAGFFKSLSGVAGQFKKQLKVETFRTIAMSIAMLVGAVAILAMVPKDRLGVAMGGVIALMGILTGIVALAQSKAFDANKMRVIGVAFAGMGAAMLSLAVTCEKLAKIPVSGLVKAGVTITAFIGMFVVAGNSAKLVQSSSKSFLAMSAAINGLIFAMNALAAMRWETIMKGGTAIMYIATELAIASRIAGRSRPGGFLSMAIAVDLLVPAIIAISMMPVEKALKGATIISGVMYAIAGAAYIVGQSKSNFKSMVAMSTVIGTTAAALAVLSLIDPVQLMTSAVALVSTLTTIAIASDIASKGMKGAIAISGVVAVLTGAIVLLTKLNAGKAIIAAAGLGILATTLASSLAAFSELNPGAALKGLGTFSLVVAGIIALMAALGGLNKLTKGVAVKGIKAFGDILEAIGEAFGRFTGGFITGMSSGLPNAAENLSKFMEQIQPFLELSKDIKGGSLKGVKNLSEVLFNLSQIDFSQIQQQDKLDGFGDALKQMAIQFIVFSQTLSIIPDGNVEKVNSIAKIMKTFTEIVDTIPRSDGLLKKVTGVKSIADFAQQIGEACVTLSLTLMTMNGVTVDEKSLDKLTQIVGVVRDFAKVADEIPASEGVAQFMGGNTTINEFAEYLADFAPNFETFQASLIGLPDIDETQLTKIEGITNVIKMMVESGSKIPPSEGLKQFISGNTTINEFANQMVLTIPGLYLFLSAISGMGELIIAATPLVPLVAAAIAALGMAADKIPKSGWLKQAIGGVKNLGKFSEQLAIFMPNFATFMENLPSSFGKGDVKKIQNIGTALESIAKLSNSLKSSGGLKGKLFGNKDLGGFSEGLEKLADGASKAAKKFEGVDTKSMSTSMGDIKKAVAKATTFGKAPTADRLVTLSNNVYKFAKKLNNTPSDGLTKKASAVEKAVKNLAKAAANGVSSKDLKKFASIGEDAAEKFIKGIKKENKNAGKAGKSVGDEAKDGMKDGAKGTYDLGVDIVKGLIKGLAAKERDAYNAGYKVGKAAVKGQKDGAKSKSPSKIAIQTGKDIGRGLVIGIDAYRKKAYRAGYDMGNDSAKGQMDGVDAAIRDISNPVITPVVDSSNIDKSLRDLNNRFTARKAMSINPSKTSTADKIAASIAGMQTNNANTTNYINVHVDGTENPEAFANRFVRQLELEMRTG